MIYLSFLLDLEKWYMKLLLEGARSSNGKLRFLVYGFHFSFAKKHFPVTIMFKCSNNAAVSVSMKMSLLVSCTTWKAF